MTLRLVVPDNVAELPVYDLKDIAGCARKLADQMESGKHKAVTRVTVLIENEDGMARESWGEMPSGYELMGILEAAKMAVFAENVAEDE